MHGFYTYGPDIDDYSDDGKAMSAKAVAEYIARYESHPAVAESRITHIDYENHQDANINRNKTTMNNSLIFSYSPLYFVL